MSYQFDGRYMFFTWSEYDNPSPFECLEQTFSDIEESKEFAKVNGGHSGDGEPLYCVFDRVEGKMLDV